LAVAYLIVSRCDRIENVSNIEPSCLYVLYVLNSIEKLFHRVVENTEICPASDNIFGYDLSLVVKLVATFVEKVEEMRELIISVVLCSIIVSNLSECWFLLYFDPLL